MIAGFCKKLIGLVGVSCVSVAVLASNAQHVPLKLEHRTYDPDDIASVKRGAKFFATNCLVCHAMRFLEFNKIAQEAGITLDKMPVKDQDWWFGVAPPDLSLSARSRSPDWLYTYLHTFYTDSHSKIGSNNLVMPNSAMPNPFAGLQGEQVLLVENITDPGTVYSLQNRYPTYLKLVRQGSLNPDEFHAQVYDLVNFLAYASEPGVNQRKDLGWWVLGFLLLLMVLTYALKKEYWKSVK